MASDIVERLRHGLGGVTCEAFRGDNLAIFIVSEFNDWADDDEEESENGWKLSAVAKADEVLDAIQVHYATEITKLRAELALEREARETAERGGELFLADLEACRAEREMLREALKPFGADGNWSTAGLGLCNGLPVVVDVFSDVFIAAARAQARAALSQPSEPDGTGIGDGS